MTVSALGPPSDGDVDEFAARVWSALVIGLHSTIGEFAIEQIEDLVVTDLNTGARVRVTVTPLRRDPPVTLWQQLVLDEGQ
jgi:hypothetical protein